MKECMEHRRLIENLSAIGLYEIMHCNTLLLMLESYVRKFSIIYKLLTLTLYRSHLMETI